MAKNKKVLVFLAIAFFVLSGIAATRPPVRPPRNLKVLPKDISDKTLDSLMETYNKALGVNCSFCHSPAKNAPEELDFAADGNPMKEQGRKMIRLTIQLNKDYFYYDTLQRPEYLKVVSCNTCHRGDAFPAEL